jgi:hypothetical protein
VNESDGRCSTCVREVEGCEEEAKRMRSEGRGGESDTGDEGGVSTRLEWSVCCTALVSHG